MNEDGKRIENWFQLHRLCRERHVPPSIMLQWDMELLNLPDRESKESHAAEKIEYIKHNYPYITAECYLAQIEQSQDWDKLLRNMHIYWKDVSSLLVDAVRTGSVNTVKQLALHVLFDNKELQEELLRLAPDENTRNALLDRAGIRTEAHYQQYPFCIRENSIWFRYSASFETISKTIITMPDDAQQVAFAQFLKEKRYSSADEMLEQVQKLTNEEYRETDLAYKLFGVGCEATDHGFVFKPIPECWAENEYAKEVWEDPIDHGLTALRAILHDLCFKFDGLYNLFGYTGYYYLEKWPHVK